MENQNPNPTGQTTINVQVPSADNIASRRPLIPVSFALAIIFFFFTFCDFKCGGQKFGSVTGINLVTGTELKGRDMFSGREIKGEEIPPSMWAILAFGAAIIGLSAFLMKEKKEAIIGTGAGAIGAGSLIILQFVIKGAIDKEAEGQIQVGVEFQFPYWGALIALGVAGFISYLRMKKSGFDIGEWFKKNRKLAIGLLVFLTAAFGVYKFFPIGIFLNALYNIDPAKLITQTCC